MDKIYKKINGRYVELKISSDKIDQLIEDESKFDENKRKLASLTVKYKSSEEAYLDQKRIIRLYEEKISRLSLELGRSQDDADNARSYESSRKEETRARINVAKQILDDVMNERSY